jgi:nicotinamidase-related amidase
MPQAAVLLMDLQCDFLDRKKGRMPVDEPGALAVIRTANQVLSKQILTDALPVLVMNQFPPTAWLANFFRHGAAVSASAGAEFDPRILRSSSELVVAKSHSSAFSNPMLERFLQSHRVKELYVLGVFAEGCVRATVVEAVKRGFTVHVIADAVASNATWKKAFALWAMARAGAEILPSLVPPGAVTRGPATAGL